jgi:hypothetical protein
MTFSKALSCHETGPANAIQAEWFRVYDGVAQKAERVDGGTERDWVAPWKGQDVAPRLFAP